MGASTARCAGALTAPEAAALAAVIHVYNRKGVVTMHDVMMEVDRSRATVHATLRSLVRKGVIGWEPQRQATLRPLVWPMAL